jgi:hypothetical protein
MKNVNKSIAFRLLDITKLRDRINGIVPIGLVYTSCDKNIIKKVENKIYIKLRKVMNYGK